jgi:hypothetical protein
MANRLSPAANTAETINAEILPNIMSPNFDSAKRQSHKRHKEPTKLTKGSYDLITKLNLSLQELSHLNTGEAELEIRQA